MKGIRVARARSIARVTFSPTADPMLPPMKPNSMTDRLTGWPPIRAVPLRRASSIPEALRAARRRSV
jgi:hypothetical protein